MRTVRAATFVVTSIWLLIQPALAENRIALVIGNGSYEKVPELPNPPRDAADIARALERLNFKVTQTKNATAHEMRKAIVDFGRAAEGAEMAVVFYAGHGMEVGGENWLIPVNAELRSDADIESEAVSLRSISLQVSKARQLGLVILDACRNNPFAAKMKRSLSTRAVARGLAPTEPSDNVLIAYAARDGTTASDGEGRNSPFTIALLRHIETPGLEISFLFRRVRDDVMAATKREQQPFVYGSLSKEEIYLRAPGASAPARPAAGQVAAVPSEDEQFWQAMRTSTAAGLYEEFLSRYPKSSHAAEARQRIKDFRSKEVAAASPTTVSPRLEDNAGTIKGGENSGARPSDRNLFLAEDSQKVAAIGVAQRFDMPKFTISPAQDDPLGANSRFVGVWSSKRGWGGGKGRNAMLIVTEVSATGLARGYYVWGPPTKHSWTRDAAGYKWFAEYIVNDKFSIKTVPGINVKLDDKNVLTLLTAKSDKPVDRGSIELRPIWQLVKWRGDAEPSAKRDQAPQNGRVPKQEPSERRSTISGPTIKPKPPGPKVAQESDLRQGKVAGQSMEDRYRACRKLVKGFAQRDACARNGGI
ncbi:caspase family protein [Bradyrhizobium sp. AUGA SZCCT0177]|uniref:caspase family protein n=1 Tax=Bradyrhizobium sp. AUGA SZCCT0177 TaxID=2807665 RepID=UPI001BAB33E2|nr:caspase family protein [Bradyrhizobium sp. AUGA SZCCT0177]MBR1281849.1 caspase family protein [Bradyrhizobium sp. AUGA SZCCT0177]